MTGLDVIIQGVGTYDEVHEHLMDLLDGLYLLNHEHPAAPYGEAVLVKPETINTSSNLMAFFTLMIFVPTK